MRTSNAATQGHEPFAVIDQVEYFLGHDGQIWRWNSGQHTVASGGANAVQWAVDNGLPREKVLVLSSYLKGNHPVDPSYS